MYKEHDHNPAPVPSGTTSTGFLHHATSGGLYGISGPGVYKFIGETFNLSGLQGGGETRPVNINVQFAIKY